MKKQGQGIKKPAAIISAVIMLLSVLSFNVGVYASGETIYKTPEGNIYFEKATGTVTWADKTITSLTIPKKIDGVKVTAIGEWAFCNRDNLVSVTIPDTVSSISKGVFFRSKGLKEIVIPDSVTSMDEQTFYECTSLTKVTLPKKLKIIPAAAFYGCSALKEITIPSSVKSIGRRAFYGCSNLLSITFKGNKKKLSLKDVFDPWYYVGGDFSASYKTGKYYKNLMKVNLTNNVRNNIINIAKSQFGYHEGKSNKDLAGNSKSRANYTEYGYYYGTNPELWCGDFAEWCLEMGGIPRSLLEDGYSKKFSWDKTVYAGKGGKKTLKKGDICRVTHDEGGHMFIVESVSQKGNKVYIKFRDGGHGNAVYADTYVLNAKTGKGTGEYSRWKMQYMVTPNYNKLVFRTLKFNANGGKVKTTSRKIAEGAMYSVLPTPTKSGRKFAGWFTKKTGGVQIKPYMPFGKKGDQTLYAHWK